MSRLGQGEDREDHGGGRHPADHLHMDAETGKTQEGLAVPVNELEREVGWE